MPKVLESLRHAVIQDPMEVIVPLIVFGVVFLIGWIFRQILLRAIRAWNQRTQSRPGHILYEGLRGPLVLWILILSAHLAIRGSDIPSHYADLAAGVLWGLWVFSLTLMGMRVVGDMVRQYGAQTPGALPVTTLTQSLAQISVLILGILILLSYFNVRITPILTALGVGGLAVALALQDTLSNLFGGFYVAVAGQVRLGDYIKLNTGEEGYVTDIGWRVTTIRALANNLIIVPNSKLSQAIVTNFYLPEKRMGTSFVVTVGYESDLAGVEGAIQEVLAGAVKDIPGLIPDPAPSLQFEPGFGESGIALTVGYQVQEFASQYPVRNELRRRIYLKLRERDVRLGYPARAVYLHGDAGDAGRRQVS